MAASKKSLYEILGIERDANALDVGLAYERRKAELDRRVPPDAAETALVQQAYEVLSDPARRAAYDATLMAQSERAAAAAQPTDLVLEAEPEEPSRTPLLVGAAAGLVVIVAALYFSLRSPPAPPPPQPPAEPPKPVVAAPPPPKPVPPATILAGAASTVGMVLSYDMGGQAKPLGLAAAIDRGVYVTTCHGIPAGAAIVVRQGPESHSASLAVNDETLDLCKLNVPDLRGAGIPLASAEPKPGDTIYVLGANAKGEVALTEGTVKQMRTAPNAKVIEISVPIARNGSGGAVFDTYGRLVGIATTEHGFGTGLSIVLPAAWFAEMRSRTKSR